MGMGRENNFNLLRLLGAFGVLVFHAYVLVGRDGDPLSAVTTWLSFGMLGVRVFFIISGYLLAASLLRNPDPVSFVAARVLRIWPALIMLALLSVFVLGPLVTVAPGYFHDLNTFEYLRLVTVFDYRSTLPGVFTANPISVVNGSVWTLALEVFCYAVLLLTFLCIRPLWLRCATASVLLVACYGYLMAGLASLTMVVPAVPQIMILEYGSFFCAGVLLALLPFRGHVALDAAVLAALVYFVLTSGFDWHPFRLAEIVCLPYLVIRFGNAPWHPFSALLARYDISYGLFLYSYPLTQVAVMWLGRDVPVPALIVVATALTVPFALLSWLLVERPALAMRDRLRSARPSVQPRLTIALHKHR